MFVRFTSFGMLLLMLCCHGCSSQTGLANSATDTMGDWSPVGSRQVVRHKHYTLAAHYRLQVSTISSGTEGDSQKQLDAEFADQFARQLRRYYLHVESGVGADSLQAALATARAGNADILLQSSVQRWPDIEPVRVQECEKENGQKSLSLKSCDSEEKPEQGEMALVVAIYDVRAGLLVDSVYAHSRRGIASFVYENSQTELETLCKLIVGQLAAQDKRY